MIPADGEKAVPFLVDRLGDGSGLPDRINPLFAAQIEERRGRCFSVRRELRQFV